MFYIGKIVYKTKTYYEWSKFDVYINEKAVKDFASFNIDGNVRRYIQDIFVYIAIAIYLRTISTCISKSAAHCCKNLIL